MALEDATEFDAVFGTGSKGSTPEERARTSSRIFVRSQVQLAVLTSGASGRQLSAWEALQAFGIDKLREVVDYGSAILRRTADEPAVTLRERRESLGFAITDVAKITGLDNDNVEDAEDPRTRTPIRIIEQIAQALALDESVISFRPEADGDKELGVRLRELSSDRQIFSPRLVSQLCETAWVVRKQNELNRWLCPNFTSLTDDVEPSPMYGEPGYPVWEHGYYLAGETRRILGISPDAPIDNLHDLMERSLNIAVVQLDLPPAVAGATVVNGTSKGIAVNVAGLNSNVWIRRMTLAHELGHLLWDPIGQLRHLQVDQFADLDESPWQQAQRRNYVEARANAFAVEFLAPGKVAAEVFESVADPARGLRRVMETFGLSFTSAKYHIWNARGRRDSLDRLTVDDYQPTDDWTGRESYAIDLFKPKTVAFSRRGLFAELVVRAADEGLLTEETAATYLKCGSEDYKVAAEFVRELLGP
jgi:hypothetical protein